MSSPGVTFNLTCDKGVTELQHLANIRLSSFAERHQMQQKNFDVSYYTINTNSVLSGLLLPYMIMDVMIFYTHIIVTEGLYM